MRFVEIFIRQPIDRFSGDKGMLDLLFRDLCFSRKAVDGRPFFHRSSTAHGKIFPQLYYRLDHATIVHVHRQPWFGDLDARAIRLRNIFFFPRYSNLSDSKNSVEIYIYIYIYRVRVLFFFSFFLSLRRLSRTYYLFFTNWLPLLTLCIKKKIFIMDVIFFYLRTPYICYNRDNTR